MEEQAFFAAFGTDLRIREELRDKHHLPAKIIACGATVALLVVKKAVGIVEIALIGSLGCWPCQLWIDSMLLLLKLPHLYV